MAGTSQEPGALEERTPSPRGPYRTGIERRRQILDAAFRVFGRRGYGTASLREIAEEVGVTSAGILRHFGSKEELLLAVLDRFDDESELNRARRSSVRGLAYFALLPGLMERHREHPGLIELLLTICTEASDPAHPARDWVVRRYNRIVQEAVSALHEALEDSEIAPLTQAQCEGEARLLFAVMDGLELQWLADPTLDLGELFRPVYESTLARWRALRPERV
ncbi:TetR/AcrR family transcriptional regulator [Rathayibacter sp. VKM Ac-2927]|uniref:TetR/AcrR family transcriptional regulator n=1 Tax=Rathayibacter sp. VKM Ac-2927 TaxID=2929478 RepID=UPI001FB406EE|nr:TetR/AcrR family transcriptional regulator [Rathayibacter sp. VKM Ac-2927]MCJ1688368.1 TetR/AcrR family transcriptional regulator [Rathayibacter sp. VKM Ac-2927]